MSTAEATPPPAHAPAPAVNLKPVIRAKIRPSDIEAIAALVAKRLTETEACALLYIRPAAWFSWKVRGNHARIFEDSLSRVKAAYLSSHLANIEAGAVGAGLHKRADWRASDRLLCIAAPDRYSPNQAAQDNSKQHTIAVMVVNTWLDQAKGSQGQVINAQEVKALPESS